MQNCLLNYHFKYYLDNLKKKRRQGRNKIIRFLRITIMTQFTRITRITSINRFIIISKSRRSIRISLFKIITRITLLVKIARITKIARFTPDKPIRIAPILHNLIGLWAVYFAHPSKK